MAQDDNRRTRDEEAAALRGTLDQVKIIATGGMSHIFKARQPSLDRFIVVKKLKDELLAQPETVERFRREAKALASVLHQNIAHVYDFVEEGRESYILMEYIEGIDLAVVIEKVGALPPPIAAAVLLNVAKGVSYIHAHNLIHRDIKPSNIRLTTRGEVKLMDFGIVIDVRNESLTRPGMMVGSPSYLSPEQVLGDPLTHKADLFLLGICLYEMLTGSRPFRDENGETVFQRIREAKFVPARRMNSKIPVELDAVVRRCLRKDPNRRYDSVKDVVTALERYLGALKSSHTEDLILKYLDEEALLTASVPYTEVVERRRQWRDLVSPVAIAGLALATLLGFLGGYLLGRGQEARQTVQPPLKPPVSSRPLPR